MIKGYAPGTILQFIFIEDRLKKTLSRNQHFIDVGSGNGQLSNLLLGAGFTGVGVDLNLSACENNVDLNRKYIDQGQYKVVHGDFNSIKEGSFDFLISSMVIEHIDDNNLMLFIENAKRIVKKDGKLIFLVPSNMNAWGIEDEIAGHVKRYSFNEIENLAKINDLKVYYKCGLNFPISNWLLNISNFIVRKNESYLVEKSELEKTVYTGNRNVKYKTVFPKYLNLVLNEIILRPFHFLQLVNSKNEKSLVMYFELIR